MKYISCPHCNNVFKFCDASNGESGWFTTCPACNNNFDIDINDFIVLAGTLVRLPDRTYGIVDGSDVETTEKFENINYYICPLEFTNNSVWSDKYKMYLREEFSVCIIPPEGVKFVFADNKSLSGPFNYGYVSSLKHKYANVDGVLGFSDLEHAICFNTITEAIKIFEQQPEWARKKCNIIPIIHDVDKRKLLTVIPY